MTPAALLLALFNVYATSAVVVSHIVKGGVTGSTGLSDFPEFVASLFLDQEEMAYFDSWTRNMEIRMKWIQEVKDFEKYISFYNTILNFGIPDTISNLRYIMRLFGQQGGVHTLQISFGCERNEDGETGAFVRFGYDGEDFTRLDFSTLTWIGANPQADIFNGDWNNRKELAQLWKGYLENDCIKQMQTLVDYGSKNLDRKVPPEVSLLRRNRSAPVTCQVTGFFPKEIVVSWQKDGEDLHEDVELEETVPNEDGTFQTRSHLRVSPADLKEHQYTCTVDHSSLEEEIIILVTDEDIKTNQDSSLPIGVIIGVVVAALLVVIITIIASVEYMKSGNRTGESMSRTGVSMCCTRISHTSLDH